MFVSVIRQFLGVGSTKMVLIVRADLKMGPGKMAAQCSHAAVGLYASARKNNEAMLKNWELNGQPKIVLKVTDNAESTLKALYENAKQQNINAHLVFDAGRTQVESGTLTVLGLGPHSSEDIDKLTKNLKLL